MRRKKKRDDKLTERVTREGNAGKGQSLIESKRNVTHRTLTRRH